MYGRGAGGVRAGLQGEIWTRNLLNTEYEW
jgi:hypothetical protein